MAMQYKLATDARTLRVRLHSPARNTEMLLKNIGILYYRLPVNHDPKSVLFEDVDEVADLDKMGEDF